MEDPYGRRIAGFPPFTELPLLIGPIRPLCLPSVTANHLAQRSKLDRFQPSITVLFRTLTGTKGPSKIHNLLD